jgi:hypothetical protein
LCGGYSEDQTNGDSPGSVPPQEEKVNARRFRVLEGGGQVLESTGTRQFGKRMHRLVKRP